MKPGLADCPNAVIVPHIASATLWTRAGMVRPGRRAPARPPAAVAASAPRIARTALRARARLRRRRPRCCRRCA